MDKTIVGRACSACSFVHCFPHFPYCLHCHTQKGWLEFSINIRDALYLASALMQIYLHAHHQRRRPLPPCCGHITRCILFVWTSVLSAINLPNSAVYVDPPSHRYWLTDWLDSSRPLPEAIKMPILLCSCTSIITGDDDIRVCLIQLVRVGKFNNSSHMDTHGHGMDG